MERESLSDEQWARLAPLVSAATRRGPRGRDDRRFIESLAWLLRTGAPWRDLPASFGKWSTAFQRFRRWAIAGRWEALRRELGRNDEAAELLLIDSTIVKAHPQSAGARRNGEEPALGRSRGGLTTKIHAAVSERGSLIRYILTGGQVGDVTQAERLVQDLDAQAVIGDKAYDSNAFLSSVAQQKMTAVIPSRANRRSPRLLDSARYAIRNVIERFFGRLKVFRRVATRYDKAAASFASHFALAASLVTLSGWEA